MFLLNKSLRATLAICKCVFILVVISSFIAACYGQMPSTQIDRIESDRSEKGGLRMKSNVKSKELELEIVLDKKEYKKGEAIKVAFSVINRGLDDVILNGRMFLNSIESPETMREIYLKVISPSGNEIPFSAFIEVGYPSKHNFKIVKSGTSLKSDLVDLTKYYDFEEIGTYEILAIYENRFGKELNIDAWVGKVISKPLRIKISR